MKSAEEMATRGFLAWKALHPNQAEDPVAIWAAAWQNGAWDALHRTSQLAELIPRLQELINLYQHWEFGDLDEVEAGSAYWKTTR